MADYIAQLYRASSPKAQVLGANVTALLGTLRDDTVRPLVIEYGFGTIDPDTWYSQQDFLDVIQAVEERLTWEELVAIGMKGADVVDFPPNMPLEEMLNQMPAAYPYFHRNVPEIEGYSVKVGERQMALICNVPYPAFILYGLVHGLIRRFCASDPRHFTVNVASDRSPYQIIVEW